MNHLVLELCASYAYTSTNTIFTFSGIANAIDLADRFLPRLQSLNCEFDTCIHLGIGDNC